MNIDDIRYPESLRYAHKRYLNAFETPLDEDCDNLVRYARLAAEFGYPDEAQALLDRAAGDLQRALADFNVLLLKPKPDLDEPEDLKSIRALRPDGPRRMLWELPADYRERFLGSFLGRGAGCTLGATLEFRSVEESEDWARYCGDAYPPQRYWSRVKDPYRTRYLKGTSNQLTGEGLDAIPVDDDTAYSLIGLLTLEACGEDFDHDDMARVWMRHMPIRDERGNWGCFWGERNMMMNLEAGVPAAEAGYLMNPNVQSVAAWTRADTWGYVAPGWPEKAAELAYKDASINHRRNGVYGAMFMAATISAAFVVNDPREAIRIGLTEIPERCLFAEGVRWALDIAPGIRDYRDAVRAVYERYDGMFGGHALVNGLFVVFGLLIGGRDFTRVIGETVAMGFDNDCTGATAGSICGAVAKQTGVPAHWYKQFNNRMHCFLMDCPEYIDLDDLCDRYYAQARRIADSENESRK